MDARLGGGILDRDSIGLSDQFAGDRFDGLTTKQCQVLDLLIEHKTSKEISRMLGISPHTVDQRILLARAKLQVTSRSQVAQAYRRLLATREETSGPSTYQRSIYGSPGLARLVETQQDRCQEGDEVTSSGVQPEQARTLPGQLAEFAPGYPARPFHHVLPEAFDGRFGTLLRLGAIAILTIFLTLISLGGLAMYAQLSHMFDG